LTAAPTDFFAAATVAPARFAADFFAGRLVARRFFAGRLFAAAFFADALFADAFFAGLRARLADDFLLDFLAAMRPPSSLDQALELSDLFDIAFEPRSFDERL